LRIAVDGMGGDFAPAAAVEGAALAAAEFGVEISVVGQPEALQPLLAGQRGLEVVAAAEVITMDEHPAQAVRRKQDSSLSVCARLCKESKADAWVSAGNSGAIMAAALFIQGRLQGIDRPALGSVVPTAQGFAYFVDVGANVDARPEFLLQFAQMGATYSERMFHVKHPRVALLSNGEEPGKGSELVKEAYARLEASGLNFIGNVEGKDIFAGKADVVVADGFVGNVAIKMAEATAEFLFRTLRDEIPRTLTGKLGGLLIRSQVQQIRARLDWREFGGAPLLGIDGVAVVAHGRSDATAVKNAIRVARDAVANGLVANIRQAVAA
jgi:phosphate acyltransferase